MSKGVQDNVVVLWTGRIMCVEEVEGPGRRVKCCRMLANGKCYR